MDMLRIILIDEPDDQFNINRDILITLTGGDKFYETSKIDKYNRIKELILKNIRDRKARDIQRAWREYWLTPYHDESKGYRISRYMISKSLLLKD